MKTIIVSIKSKWCEKIGNEEKPIEVRKSAPKEVPFKVLLYCTKGKENLYLPQEHDCWENDEASALYLAKEPLIREDIKLNGKVIGEFICDKVEVFYGVYIPYRKENTFLGYEKYLDNGVYKVNGAIGGIAFERNDKYIDSMLKNSDLKKMCLSAQELFDYNGVGRDLFAWHISNLKIYSKPKELSKFGLDKAPQSWQYINKKYKENNDGKKSLLQV